MKHVFRRSVAIVVAIMAMAAPPGVPAGESGLALGPALILVRDVPPGRPFTLQEAAKVRFRLTNHSNQPGDFEVVCSLPSNVGGMRSHEVGYEAPPDLSWFTLDKKVVTLAAHAQEEFDLRINIPDLPEHYNRHWMLYIEGGRAKHAGIGATLRLRARVMLETRVQEGIGEALGRTGMIGLDPGTVQMRSGEGAWAGQVRLRNNTAHPAVYDLLRLDQILPEEQADKRARYFDHAAMATRATWGRPAETSVALAPGEERIVRITSTPEAGSPPSSPIEEVLFIVRRAPEGADPKQCREFVGRLYDHAGLVRLRFATQATGGAPPAP